MPTYNNRGRWGKNNAHAVRSGRTGYLSSDKSARPANTKALTTVRHHVRTGRAAYVDDVFGQRRS